MNASVLHRFDVVDRYHGPVPCAAVLPRSGPRALPLCLFLYGGGGSRESLAEVQPLLDAWWGSGALPPMLVATPDVGPFSFYLDDPPRGMHWEGFVAERFTAHLRSELLRDAPDSATGIVGISMGGYGALKIALARPDGFRAVAAISPMIEPASETGAVPLRNRWHYPPEVPAALLGQDRDLELYLRDHPAARARRNAAELRRSELAIYLDASGADALNAHDGAEHLHRVLWQLDIAHEYRLRRDADHIGPEIGQRLLEAFAWVGARTCAQAQAPLTDVEQRWHAWLDGDRRDAPPAVELPPTSVLFPQVLRARLAPLREAAARADATLARRFGVLPRN